MSNTGNTFIFKVPQQFGAATSAQVIMDLQSMVNSDYTCIVLDLSDTVMIDSSGIGVLVFMYKELTANSKAFILKKPQRDIYNLLIETGIDRLFEIEMSSGTKKAEAELGELDTALSVTEEMVGDVCVLSLSGVMNYPAGSMYFKKNMFLAISESKRILLDFSQLAFFDSLSVGSILRLSRLLADNGGELRIAGANHVIRNVFESLGIDSVVPFYDTRESAFADWE
ncbi:MAG: STAS domain-containing protein [Chitinispirillales bacterium]|jgi:anti-anti-sigma factor|nr:STAS domain-containing protein [Chitinispirillales bacterium]